MVLIFAMLMLNCPMCRTIFNMGAVLGSAIQLGLSWNESVSNDVSSTIYAVFVGLSSLAVVLPLFLISPARMVRTDGSRVIVPSHPSKLPPFTVVISHDEHFLTHPYLFVPCQAGRRS